MADSELALLQQYARTRDAFAFRKLVEQHQDMVFAACHRVLGNRADAEDAAQNCFLKLAQAAGRLKAPIGGWLHTVAVHGAIDMLRGGNARRARERSVASDARRAGAHETPWADVRGEVDAAIVALPERLRTPIVLYFLEGRTQADVATELGVQPPAVSKRLRRGVESMRRRLKRAGIVAPAVALTAMLTTNTAEAASPVLTATLGKVALAGASSAKAAAVTTGGTLAALKTTAALVVAAGAGAGAVVVQQATNPPRPLPIAAAAPAAPVEKKAPRVALTTETVLDAELTLEFPWTSLARLRNLAEEQLGVSVACAADGQSRHMARLKPGTYKVRDVLAAVTAATSLTTEIVPDRDRVVICFWPREPDAQILADVMKLAASKDAAERCAGARWLRFVSGRAALVQLLKMLADPDAQVRGAAAMAISQAWVNTSMEIPILHLAPEGLALDLLKSVRIEKGANAGSAMLDVVRSLHDPKALPVLKELLAARSPDGFKRTAFNSYALSEAVAGIGGPEAEAILLAAVGHLPRADVMWALSALGNLGTDAAVARLGQMVAGEMKRGERGELRTIIWALGASRNPAAVPELIRIVNLPGVTDNVVHFAVGNLAGFDTPEAQAACLARFQATTDSVKRRVLARSLTQVPAVQRILLEEWLRGGDVGRRAALSLVNTRDPRAVLALVDVLNMDDKIIAAAGSGSESKWAAMVSLGRSIPGPEAEKAFIAYIKRGRPLDKMVALADLGSNFSSPEAREVLMAAMRGPNDSLRAVVARVLGWRRDPADLDCLLTAARKENLADELNQAGKAMWKAVGRIGGERAAKELLSEIANGNTVAAQALILSHDPHCVKAVRDVLTGDDARQRAVLMEKFDTNAFYNSQSVFYVVESDLAALPQADDDLQEKLALRLGSTPDPRVIDPLGKLLGDAAEPAAVRRAAVTGLAGIYDWTRHPAAIEPLRHAYEHDTDEEVKKVAKTALMNYRIIPDDRPAAKPRPPKKRVPKGPADPTLPPDEREFPPPPEP